MVATTGIKALRKLQMGKETTAGTAVTPTTMWRGIGTIQENREVIFPNEDVGVFAGTDRNYAARADSILQLENTEATFEQLPYIFEMGMHHDTAATTDGEFDWAFPIASSDTYSSSDLATYTWEGGDNIAAVYFDHGFVRTFNLSGEAGGALMVNAEVFGGETAPTTDSGNFTSGISIPTVEEILFSRGILYIDDTSPGTIGGTQISNTLLSMNMAVTTGWMPVYTATGSLDWSFVKQTQPEIVVSFTFEHNASAVAEIADWRANSVRLIRVYFANSGATKTLTIDMAGRWDNFEKIGERDGNDIVTGNFRVRYSSANALFFEVALVNGLAALP
jgi:hypothetical protein